jgi:exopolysaccharide biosynthesis polyprenyl glycosylphosphotransferase
MLQTRQYLLALGDLIMFTAGLALMIMLRFGPHYDAHVVHGHAASFVLVFALWLVIFFVFNLYDVRSSNPSPRTIGMLAMAMGSAVVLGGFLFYVHPIEGIAPRTNLLIVGMISFVLVVAWRRAFYRIGTSLFPRSIVLIGASPEMSELKKEIDAHPEMGIVRAFWLSAEERTTSPEILAHADLIILESNAPETFVAVNKNPRTSIRTLIDAYQEFFARVPLSLMTEEAAVRVAARAEGYGYRSIKRLGEILISAFVLVATSPIVLVACIAKKLEDGGPAILPSHLRVGKNGIAFKAYKIRSMIMDADKSGAQWTKERDSRITPVGQIIRKLHIDEIPQFWNILRGEMSLVGPRPEQPKFVDELEKAIPYYYLRHTIKPGFTGWAQIKFRYARTVSDSEKKWEYDLYYLMNRSLLLDVGIVLKTIQIIFTH